MAEVPTRESRNCPDDVKESIERYILGRYPPGHFLMAVLENNLKEAIGRADERMFFHLGDIVAYVWNKIPLIVWGSVEKVLDHLNGKTGAWIKLPLGRFVTKAEEQPK